jgi:hypothetical protein
MVNMSMNEPETVFMKSVFVATHITFSSGISIDTRTGEVTIPDGMSLSDASKAFWVALHITFPSMEWNRPS